MPSPPSGTICRPAATAARPKATRVPGASGTHVSAAPPGAPPPGGGGRRILLAAAIGTLFGAILVVGIVAFVRARPDRLAAAGEATAPEAAAPARVVPGLEWRTSSLRATWSSELAYDATLEAEPAGITAAVRAATEPYRTTTHSVSLLGLLPDTPYRVRCRAEGADLFAVAGRTAKPADAAARLVRALADVDPWGLLVRMRKDFAQASSGETAGSEAAKRRLAKWEDELVSRRRGSGLDSVAADFESVRDSYFAGGDVPIVRKLELYRLLQELRELEMACGARGLSWPLLFVSLSSRHMGMAGAGALDRPRSLLITWRHLLGKPGCDAGSLEPAQTTVQSPDRKGSELRVFSEKRLKRFEPQERSGILDTVEHWHSDLPEGLPLPDPTQVAAAELRAYTCGLHLPNALRLYLKPPGKAWLAIADLRGSGAESEQLWHGLDPRLLAPGARLRVELIFFPEDEREQQKCCLMGLEFRWKAR